MTTTRSHRDENVQLTENFIKELSEKLTENVTKNTTTAIDISFTLRDKTIELTLRDKTVERQETEAIAAMHSAIELVGRAQDALKDVEKTHADRRAIALYQEVSIELEKISERLTGKMIGKAMIGKAIGVRALASWKAKSPQPRTKKRGVADFATPLVGKSDSSLSPSIFARATHGPERDSISASSASPCPIRREYERNGVANLFMTFAPLEDWRKVKVTDHHAAVDYAQLLKELSDVYFPDAKQIVLVQDNLNTHTAASLYAAFPAEEARRLAKRFEWHYTPKHGSWLDMAESELAILTNQCLNRRIPDKPTLEREVAAWEAHRNKHHAKADWQFTTADARVKLKRLYPQF